MNNPNFCPLCLGQKMPLHQETHWSKNNFHVYSRLSQKTCFTSCISCSTFRHSITTIMTIPTKHPKFQGIQSYPAPRAYRRIRCTNARQTHSCSSAVAIDLKVTDTKKNIETPNPQTQGGKKKPGDSGYPFQYLLWEPTT